MINGLAPLVAHLGDGIPVTKVVNGQTVAVLDENGVQERIIFSTADASDILLGGGGSDIIKGLAGNDIIDGDKWLNVRIRFVDNGVIYTVDEMKGLVYREADYVNGTPGANAVAQFGGRSLDELMFDRTVNPGQLEIVREIVDGDILNTGVDVAVYTDVLANYTFTRNADGSITVAHTPPADVDPVDPIDPTPEDDEEGETPENENENGENDKASDGTDRLFNIEKLRFSDGNGGTVEYFLNQLPFPATGAPIIVDPTPTNGMVSPTEGQQLTVNTSDIQDMNGLGTFSYQWQVSDNGGATWDNVNGATTASYTPGEGLLGFFGTAGSILRVRVTFTDGGGHQEVLYSAATSVVGDNWDAVPFLANTFNGTAGDDVADGTSGLFGLGANDTLNGNGGNDILNGAGGSDTLNGGAGDDRLDGGAGSSDTAVYNGAIGDFALGSNGTNLVVTDLTGAEGSDTLSTVETLRFAGTNYSVVAGTTGNNANLNGGSGANGSQAIFGHAGTDSLNGGAANDLLVGGQGNDAVNGGAGNDTAYWTAGDGREFIDGGADTDTVKMVGDSTAETFRIYSRTEALAVGITVLNANTEIVITRNGTNDASIIAELDNIEEIVISGRGGGDTFIPIGTFAGTSLLTSTITLDGSEDNDTVDITSLQSAHRVVFRSNGGNDTIIGTMRPQDVIELLPGAAVEDYEMSVNDDGSKTISADGRSVTYFGNASLENGVDDDGGPGNDDNDNDEDDETPPDDADDDIVTPPSGTTYTGTAHNDVLNGSEGDDSIVAFAGDDVAIGNGGADAISAGDGADFINGGDGRDVIFAGAGDDHVFGGGQADIIYGEAGADRIFGDEGNDMINAGAGDDTIFGGAGDDLIVAEVGDGNDVYFGDEGDGGTGIDTLDMSAATANVTVNLGSGPLSNGTASSSQTGNDTIWGIENVNTGSGNDTITASNAVNVMNGGAGNDTFKFTSASAADGDTILTFEPGDRVDLTAIDANTGTAGDQSFTLVNGAPHRGGSARSDV